MHDIWAFLLQTLTASGAAVLLLIVKAMLRDKLSPRWQFAIWGVLGVIMLIPAGCIGRYVLFNWPMLVEIIKTRLSGEYTLTRIIAPIPLLDSFAPENIWDWLFIIYFAGVLLMAVRYLTSYLRLRSILRRGTPANEQRLQQIREVAEQYFLPVCPAVEVPGLSSAFVCGVISPVLVLPADTAMDQKILLHELMHLKHRDVIWGILICFFRCIHWCNPLLWYCANQAGNDLESLCDQRVMERLEGEERREYGMILLSMANEKYARTPGTSSMANGGKNIRRRIEAITRFKRYPAGMALVSVCAVIVLATPLLLGTQAKSVYNEESRLPGDADIDLSLASARTVWCTTPAGALDAYGKSLLVQSGTYRAMCAPMEMQDDIAQLMHQKEEQSHWPTWETGVPCWVDQSYGYYIYNLEPVGEDAYKALVVVKLNYPPDGQPGKDSVMYLATRNVRVEKEDGRWVVIEEDEFQTIESAAISLDWGCGELPHYVYADTAADFRVEVCLQKSFVVDNTVEESNDMSWLLGTTTSFDTVPKPNAEFDKIHWSHWIECVYVGSGEDPIHHLGVSVAPMEHGEERPALHGAGDDGGGGSSSSGASWSNRTLGLNWGPVVSMGGGGTSYAFDKDSLMRPDSYAAELYVNREKAAELTLRLQGGGAT